MTEDQVKALDAANEVLYREYLKACIRAKRPVDLDALNTESLTAVFLASGPPEVQFDQWVEAMQLTQGQGAPLDSPPESEISQPADTGGAPLEGQRGELSEASIDALIKSPGLREVALIERFDGMSPEEVDIIMRGRIEFKQDLQKHYSKVYADAVKAADDSEKAIAEEIKKQTEQLEDLKDNGSEGEISKISKHVSLAKIELRELKKKNSRAITLLKAKNSEEFKQKIQANIEATGPFAQRVKGLPMITPEKGADA